MSTLRVSTISNSTGTGNIQVTGGNIVAPNGVVQIKYATAMPTSHISTTVTTEASVPLTASITPTSTTSKIKVEFFSTMGSGSASALITMLYRRINGGSWTLLTPVTASSSRYTYGWSYDTNAWSSRNNIYFDSPNTTGLVEYIVNYRLYTGSTVAYVVHQYQEYGYVLTEIAQ